MALAPSPWTEKLVEDLRRLWAEGWSASDIAAKLDGNWTRCSVLGKANRLGLPRRVERLAGRTPGPQISKRKKVDRPVFMLPPPPPPPPPSPPLAVPLLQLRARECRWPLGEFYERAKVFCAVECRPGLPYCDQHMLIAFAGRFAGRRP